MTASNPDQDDFDPSLEEGTEDFSYNEESFEDTEFSEEDSWDEEGFEEEAGEESAAGDESSDEKPVKKKKGGLFNVALILLALIGGGGFVYLKILAPGTATPPAQQSTPQQAELPPAETALPVQQAETTPLSAPEQPSTASNEPLLPPPVDALAAPEAPPALADIPADIAVDTPAAVPPVTDTSVPPPPAQPVEVASAPPMPAPIAAPTPAAPGEGGFSGTLPSAKDIMLAAPAPMASANEAPSGISADAAKSIEQKLSVLLARLDTFEGRITSLENGVHQISSEVSTLKSKPAPTPDLSSVNQAIEKLEKKMGSLETGAPAAASAPAAPVAETPAPAADVSKLDQPTFIPAVEEEKAPAPVVNAVDTPKAPAATTAVKTEKPVAAPKVTSWVLRSAQPGAAMVAPKEGGDMRSIKVGDTLSGIGRIVAIEMSEGRWVVRGSSGTITR